MSPHKYFSTQFEYKDGYANTQYGLSHLRGIRHNSNRPFYITFSFTASQEEFNNLGFDDRVKEYFFMEVMPAMGPGPYKGRIMIKPAWFHKLLTTKE